PPDAAVAVDADAADAAHVDGAVGGHAALRASAILELQRHASLRRRHGGDYDLARQGLQAPTATIFPRRPITRRSYAVFGMRFFRVSRRMAARTSCARTSRRIVGS